MTQGILPYKHEEEKRPAGMTSLAGLPLNLDLAFALGIPASIGGGWRECRVVVDNPTRLQPQHGHEEACPRWIL